MRILFITRRFFPTISGMSVYAKGLVEYLVQRGHDVHMIAQYRGDEAGKTVYGAGPPDLIAGAKVIGADSTGEASSGDFELDITDIVHTAEGLAERSPFDLVHAQYGYPPGFAAIQLARRWRIPAVVSIQGGDGHWVGTCCTYHNDVMRTVIERSSCVLIGSASFAEKVAARWDCADQLTVVPGAVDTGRFFPRPDGEGRPHMGEEAWTNILYHGRIDRRKGIFELVDAFTQLADPSTRLLFSGVGPDLEELRSYCADRGLAQIELLGRVTHDKSPELYRSADIFVSPTYMEGFSNTILEAMASGLPIISTNAVGVVDCLRNGETAILVPPRDVTGLVAAMSRLMASKELRARLASAALEEVRARYTWELVGPLIEHQYRLAAERPVTSDWDLPVDQKDYCEFRQRPEFL